MPIVITPTNKGRDAMGGGGMDIAKTPPKDPGANKKMKKMAGKMEDMREYMDTLDGIEEGMKSKVFPKIYNDEGVMVADDPDSALELIADEISTQDVDMYMDAIRSGDHEALIDALDGFGYRMKFIGDPMSRYNEEDTLEEGGVKNMMIDVEDGMSKEEFEEKYPGGGDTYDEIKQEILDRQDEDTEEPVAELESNEDIEMEDDCGCDEEAVDAMVSVPVQELQDILQLAGYENYSDKIQEYANEPEEEYSSVEDQLIGLSGGLNGPKKSYPASAPGDNPMDQEPREVEETMEAVEEKLYKSYKDFLEEAEIKVDEDSEFDNVVKSRNEIKINKYLAKQDTNTANRLGKKHYGKNYDDSKNPERNRK